MPSEQRLLKRDFWLTRAPFIALGAAAFALALVFIKPAPPRKLTLAYAPDEGGANWFAKKYQQFLARNGVTLELHATQGSLTNLDLLSNESEVSVAFVQSGASASPGPSSRSWPPCRA